MNTHNPMNSTDIAAARELIRAATPGPWGIWERSETTVRAEDSRLVAGTGGYSTNQDNGEHQRENYANAHLIAHMRTAYPAALDALEKCRAALEECARVGRDLSQSVERQALYSEQNWKDAALNAGRRLARIAAAAISETRE